MRGWRVARACPSVSDDLPGFTRVARRREAMRRRRPERPEAGRGRGRTGEPGSPVKAKRSEPLETLVVATPERVTFRLETAGLGSRFVAQLVDDVVLGAL